METLVLCIFCLLFGLGLFCVEDKISDGCDTAGISILVSG